MLKLSPSLVFSSSLLKVTSLYDDTLMSFWATTNGTGISGAPHARGIGAIFPAVPSPPLLVGKLEEEVHGAEGNGKTDLSPQLHQLQTCTRTKPGRGHLSWAKRALVP